ncbi:hypothetical protein [Larkinella rosea]|uniref:Uncharacterized protein n=1 Tax=Larkinella rosea TaxID=2025312 RepID=A0A3P1BNC6_9BACT|nr:hypothetical protein [Larkinella rosea]RRB02597.1 hypothetical protein EHT25_19305 [Larkinella rosea]
MKTVALFSRSGLLFLLVVALHGLQSCKNQDVEPEFHLSATVGGKAWRANVNNSQNTTVGAAKVNNYVVIIGQQKTDKTATLVVIFPKNVALNQSVKFTESQPSTLAYTPDDVNAYSMEPSRGGSGTYTVTRYDEQSQLVEGTFSGEAINVNTGAKLKITDGRFRSRLFDVQPTTTPAPNTKR